MRLGKKMFVAVLALVATLAAGADGVMLDGYAAAVDDRIITVGDVKAEMQRGNRDLFLSMQRGEKIADELLAEIYNDALDELIARALVIEEFERLEEDEKAALPEDAVDKRIQDIVRGRYDGSRTRFFEDLKRSEMTFAEFKEQQRENLILLIMRNQQFAGKVSVPPGAVRERYLEDIEKYRTPAQCRLSMIVLDIEDGDKPEEELARARSLLARLRSGADFYELARAESEGSRAEEGGARGWIETRDLREDIREAVEELQPGETSGIILAEDSIYIVKLEERREAGAVPFGEVQDKIRSQLLEEEQARMMDSWVEQLKEKHYVKKYPLPDQF